MFFGHMNVQNHNARFVRLKVRNQGVAMESEQDDLAETPTENLTDYSIVGVMREIGWLDVDGNSSELGRGSRALPQQ